MQTITIAVMAITAMAGLITIPNLVGNNKDKASIAALTSIYQAEKFIKLDYDKYATSFGEIKQMANAPLNVDDANAEYMILGGYNCFAAFAQSNSGKVFYTHSKMNAGDYERLTLPWPATAPANWPIDCVWPTSFKPAPPVMGG